MGALATDKALKELDSLVRSAAQNIYRRVELAAQVLGDLDWIARKHGGNDHAAADWLTETYFPDLAGFTTVSELTAVYRAVPKKRWEHWKFNIAGIIGEHRDQAKERARAQMHRPAWKQIAEERKEKVEQANREVVKYQKIAQQTEQTSQQEVAKLQKEIRQAKDHQQAKLTEIEELRKRNAELETENKTLREENHRLRDTIRGLRKQLESVPEEALT